MLVFVLRYLTFTPLHHTIYRLEFNYNSNIDFSSFFSTSHLIVYCTNLFWIHQSIWLILSSCVYHHRIQQKRSLNPNDLEFRSFSLQHIHIFQFEIVNCPVVCCANYCLLLLLLLLLLQYWLTTFIAIILAKWNKLQKLPNLVKSCWFLENSFVRLRINLKLWTRAVCRQLQLWYVIICDQRQSQHESVDCLIGQTWRQRSSKRRFRECEGPVILVLCVLQPVHSMYELTFL